MNSIGLYKELNFRHYRVILSNDAVFWCEDGSRKTAWTIYTPAMVLYNHVKIL